MFKGNAEHFVPKYTPAVWEKVREDIRRGQSIPSVAKKYGMPHTTIYSRAQREKWGISELRCIERGRGRLGKAPERRLVQALANVQVKEIEVELADNGERLRKCGLRTRVTIAELVEAGLEGLKSARGLSIVGYSRALAAFAAVGRIIHGWDREPVPEPWGAINLPLMRMTPEQMRNAPFRSQMPEWWEEERRRGIERAAAQSGDYGSAGQEPGAGASSQPVSQVEQTDVGMANLMRAFEQRRELAQAESRTPELEKAEAHGDKIWLPTDGKSKEEQLAQAGISKGPAERLRAARLARAVPQEPAAVAAPELSAQLSPHERRQRELENLARERAKWREHRS
jgi:hypothetical protein